MKERDVDYLFLHFGDCHQAELNNVGIVGPDDHARDEENGNSLGEANTTH